MLIVNMQMGIGNAYTLIARISIRIPIRIRNRIRIRIVYSHLKSKVRAAVHVCICICICICKCMCVMREHRFVCTYIHKKDIASLIPQGTHTEVSSVNKNEKKLRAVIMQISF